MKKEFIPVRNLIITLLVFILVLIVTEAGLSVKNRESELSEAFSVENQNILLLQTEQNPIEIMLMSATNVKNIKSAYEKDGIDFVAEYKEGYPLIGNVTAEIALEDAFNIVVIGDSFVWGAYSLNRNELFWRVLENDFRKDGTRVNVFGVGTSGANAYEELSWLTDYSLIEDLNPDLVIFGYVYNDSDDSVDIEGSTVNWYEELPVLSAFGRIFPNIYKGLIQRISAKTMYTDKYSDSEYVNLDGAPPVLKGRFYEKYKTDFAQKLDAFAAEASFPVAVVTLPTLPDNMMLEALYEPLEDIYSECENVSYYNLVDAFNEFASSKHSKNYSVNPADFHPGSATNRFYADYIRNLIENDYGKLLEEYKNKYTKDNTFIINDYLPYGVSPKKLSENEEEVVYSISYPDVSKPHSVYGIEVASYYLNAPLGKSHIKLSFSKGESVSKIILEGEYSKAEVYYTAENSKLGYDDHSIFECENTAEGVYGIDSDEKITSVLISASFEEDNRGMKLTIKKGEEVAE